MTFFIFDQIALASYLIFNLPSYMMQMDGMLKN